MTRLLLVVAALVTSTVASEAQARGSWTYGSSKDELTDVQRVNISANSAPTYSDHGYVITGTLVWRCSAVDGVEVFLLLDKYFAGSEEHVLVEYRFDSEPSAEPVLWGQSTNKRGTFMPEADIARFTEHAKRSKRVIIRVTDPLDSEAITYTFSLLGFTSAHRRFESNCPTFRKPADLKTPPTDADSGIALPSDQVFMESVVEDRPEILSGPSLQYPDVLRQAGVNGRVIVQAIIDTSGRAEPSSVKIIQSPNPGFDVSARNYVLQALFRPARIHGRAVRVLVNLPIDFTIKR